MQEIVLGIGGWRLLEALGIELGRLSPQRGACRVRWCWNARAPRCGKTAAAFRTPRWPPRVPATCSRPTRRWRPASICSRPALIEKYVPQVGAYLGRARHLARRAAGAWAARTRDDHGAVQHGVSGHPRASVTVNGVSRCTARVSRRLFAALYPRWPRDEVRGARHQRRARADLGLGVRPTTVDGGLRQGALAGDDGGRCSSHSRRVDDTTLWTMPGAHAATSSNTRASARAATRAPRGAGPRRVDEAAEHLRSRRLTLGFARRFAELQAAEPAARTIRSDCCRLLTNRSAPGSAHHRRQGPSRRRGGQGD